jgi:glycosyltransferase involved in cell wall biosynthesis
MRSIAGDAAWQFDPRDPAAMLEALRRITGDETLRSSLREAGPRRAAQFSWKATAEKTLEAVRSVCRPPL